MKIKKTPRKPVLTRPKRHVLILNRFVPMFLAGAVLLSLGLVIINSMIMSGQETERENYISNIVDACAEYERASDGSGEEGYGSEELNNKLAKLKGSLTVFQLGGFYGDVRNKDTGEVIAKTTDRMCVVLRTGDQKESEFYICEDKSLFEPVLKQYSDRLDKLYRNYMADWTREGVYSFLNIGEDPYIEIPVTIKPADIFVNEEDHTFLPGKVMIFIENSREYKQIMIDCTPEDTNGYTHIYESDCESYFSFNSFGMDRYLSERSDNVNQLVGESFPDLEINYYSLNQVSVFSAVPELVFFAYVLLAAVTFLIALVLGSIRYGKVLAVYEVFEYRKKVTESLAHDLKTPLAAISAYSENLEENADSDRRKYYLEKIRENVGSMNRMIEGVLDFSRSENCAVRIGEVEVRKLVEEEFESIRALFEKNDLAVEIKGEDVMVRTDAALLRQAVKNLLSNAAKFARKGSRVTIAAGKDSLVIENETDGKITDTEEIKKPFVKGSSERGETEGTGLGLAIADSSLTAAGHRLDIKQEGDLFRAKVIW